MDENNKRPSSRVTVTNLSSDNNTPETMVENAIAAMKESGTDEETLLRTRKLLEAKFGIGSWQDVIALHEEILQQQEAENYIDGQLATLIQLTEYAINAGDKEKAKQFILKAEGLLEGITAVDVEQSLPQPTSITGETLLQLRRAEIQRLHNWIF